MRIAILAAVAAGALLSSLPAFAEIITYGVKLNGAAETPPNASKGTGKAVVTVDTVARTISWKIDYAGLSGPVTMAHFHGPAAPGVAAGVTVPIPVAAANPIIGQAAITDGQIGDLRAGTWYINLHTALVPKGEIRGQVTKAP